MSACGPDIATFVLDGNHHSVPRQALTSKCSAFAGDPTHLRTPYVVRSKVSAASFEAFVHAIERMQIEIRDWNAEDLLLLCREFGFQDLLS
jgi:hypothetical protein